MRAFYVLVALLMLGGYAYAGWNGKEFQRAKRQTLTGPPAARGTTGVGGVYYRGYRGGK